MVDGIRVLFRIHDRMHGAAIMSEDLGSLRLTVAIYYPGGSIPNGDLARRLAGLEWWISTSEELPPGKLKVLDLTQLKD